MEGSRADGNPDCLSLITARMAENNIKQLMLLTRVCSCERVRRWK
jgi:hypothetical protein